MGCTSLVSPARVVQHELHPGHRCLPDAAQGAGACGARGEVLNDVAGAGHRWVTLGFATRPGADGNAMQELLAQGVLPMTVFTTDDVDALFERLRATGTAELLPPDREDSPARHDIA